MSVTMMISGTGKEEFADKTLSFKELDPKIQSYLEKISISTPTPIQSASFYPAMAGRDILAQSMTGSGKTLAFSLPLLQQHLNDRKNQHQEVRGRRPHTLILAPTRELAEQVVTVVRACLPVDSLRCVLVIGGNSYHNQERSLREGVDVVVGTPGRIADMVRKGTLNLGGVSRYVLDEVDQMLDIGFKEELDFIRSEMADKIHTLFFSATLGGQCRGLANDLLVDPISISMGKNNAAPTSIEHGYLLVQPPKRIPALMAALFTFEPKQAIIFCESKRECADVCYALSSQGLAAGQLNSDLNQHDRSLAMNQFREGRLRFLVATNIAARGIDVAGLPMVINIGVPKDPASYTHRTGRTGRAGLEGKAWTILTSSEWQGYQRLLRTLNATPKAITLPQRENYLTGIIQGELAKLRAKPEQTDEKSICKSLVDQYVGELDDAELRSVLKSILLAPTVARDIGNPASFIIKAEEIQSFSRGGFRSRRPYQDRGSYSGDRGRSQGGGGYAPRSNGGGYSNSSNSGRGGQDSGRAPFKRRSTTNSKAALGV